MKIFSMKKRKNKMITIASSSSTKFWKKGKKNETKKFVTLAVCCLFVWCVSLERFCCCVASHHHHYLSIDVCILAYWWIFGQLTNNKNSKKNRNLKNEMKKVCCFSMMSMFVLSLVFGLIKQKFDFVFDWFEIVNLEKESLMCACMYDVYMKSNDDITNSIQFWFRFEW